MIRGGGKMSHRRHRKFTGRPGHNRDLIQTARELNDQQQTQEQIRQAKKGEMFDSVQEALAATRRKKKR